MDINAERVERISALHMIETPGLSSQIQAWQARYQRAVPLHYQGNPYIRDQIDLNILFVPGGRLVVPSDLGSNFSRFYEELKVSRPELFYRILMPSGAAKSTSTDNITPIKEIANLCLSGDRLPGDEQLYGWDALDAETTGKGLALQVLFQGNGLYYNRGSVFYDGAQIYAYPDAFLADIYQELPAQLFMERLALDGASLKRPLFFFTTGADGRMGFYRHDFFESESYFQGMQRLGDVFRQRQVQAALAASPPLILPGADGEPVYLELKQVLCQFHANDVRHYLYCPYQGAVLLSAEMGRAQSLQPGELARSISGDADERIHLPLAETLNFVATGRLTRDLGRKSYGGRFELLEKRGELFLAINPLEGVYSHLLVFLTRSGLFGLIQTSGTHGSVTGNDGPTYRQLSAILKDLNQQAPFDTDPMIALVSGSQGNDVPNVVCRGANGAPGMLYELAGETRMDENQRRRGTVTTPRVGLAISY
jgi:hypothetical protein